MATETGPDLTAAREALEALMDDTCRIDSDPEGAEDDLLDPDTLELVPPVDDVDVIYEGRCLVSPATGGLGIGQQQLQEGGAYLDRRLYALSLPLASAPVLRRGMLVTVTSSRRDPQLIDQQFRVLMTTVETFAISRDALIEYRALA